MTCPNCEQPMSAAEIVDRESRKVKSIYHECDGPEGCGFAENRIA